MEKSTDSSSGGSSSSSPSTSSSPPSSSLTSGNNAGGGVGGGPSFTAQHTTMSPPSSKVGGGCSQATTQHSRDGSQQQHPAQQPQQPTTTTTTMFMQKHQNNSCSSTKNQLNSLGCGPSAAATSTSPATFANSGNLKASNGNKHPTATNISSSFCSASSSSSLSLNNSSTLGHQSCTSAAVTNTTTNISPSASNVLLSNGLSPASSTSSSSSSSSTQQMAPINLNISTTTGGNFSVSVDPQITVENLKKIIAKKLKVAKDRICLLHREKELQDGSLKENNLMDGSKIILIPNVETGLLAQRPENTVMQALESLNDSQVNDFLSGKTPLNLSMRLGDHMMLIQLQLSTVNPVNSAAHSGSNCSSSSRTRSSHHHHHHHHRSSSSRGTSTASTATQTGNGSVVGTTAAAATNATAAAAAPAPAPPNHSHHHHHHHHHHHGNVPGSIASTASTPVAVVMPTAQNVTAVRKLELNSTSACQSRTNANNTTSTSPSNIVATAAVPTVMISQSSSTTRMTSMTNGSSSSSSSSSTAAAIAVPTKSSDLSSFLSKRDYESLQNIVKSIAMAQPSRLAPVTTTNAAGSAVQSSSPTTPIPSSTIVPVVTAFHAPSSAEAVLLEQSPIKSLSNLVSSPIKTTAIKNIPHISNNSNSSSNVNSVALGPHSTAIAVPTAAPASICQDPIAAKLTSCLCTRLNGGSSSANMPPHATAKQCIETSCMSQQQQQAPQQQLQQQRTALMTSTPNYKATNTGAILTPPLANGATSSPPSASSSRSSASLHKTAHNAITRKHRHHHHHHHHHHHYHHPAVQSANGKLQPSITSTPTRGISNDSGFNSGDDTLNSSTQSPTHTKTPAVAAAAAVSAPVPVVVTAPLASVSSAQTATAATPIELDESGIVSDSRTLAEASRNLTQTLRKLSKEVFTNKIDFSASEETPRKSGSGAVIESMKNHGKGIYSGTFSGTLNPALQDRYGRPKRDISTVIHILNDLLSATPQYHRGARISFEAPSTSAAAAASVAAASGSSGTIHHSSRSKHLSSKHHHSSHPCVKCIKTHNASLSASNLSAVSTNVTGSLPTATGGSGVSGSSSSSSSSTSSSICAYGECNGHYVSKSQSTKNYPCCQLDSANTTSTAISGNGHHHSSHHHHHHQVVDERKVCQCRYRIHNETGEREREHTCQKCATEMDNMKTKSKLDQLRLVMQQRKQKREARKLKGAPYGARLLGATTAAVVDAAAASTLSASNSAISATNTQQPISVASAATTPSEVSPNHIVEEVDTAA